jgi:predicted N-acetyltransferase YhbS
MTSPDPAPDLALTFVHETAADAASIEALLDRAFGPGRFVKVSERVREFATFAPELSFCAFDGGKLVGVVRMWRVCVGAQPAVFLGPLAVDEDQRRAGLGGQLIERACQAAKAAGEPAVVLVGDEPYFGRFGFEIAPDVTLPGPVDPRRVLALSLRAVVLGGPIQPRPTKTK